MPAWSSPVLQAVKPGPRAQAVVTKLGPVIKRISQISSIIRLLLVLKLLLGAYRHVYAYGILGTGQQIYTAIKNALARILLRLPGPRAKVESELGKVRSDLLLKLAPTSYPDGVQLTNVRQIPEHGRDLAWLRNEWDNLKKLEGDDVEAGRVSGAVYHGGDDLNQIISEATSKFIITNPLHPDVFPGVRKMEAELVSMVLKLFNCETGAGTTTSGGTESILMSVKTHRDWARDVKRIKEPEMIIPVSAHAAFFKAAEYFCIKAHSVPVDPKTRKVDPKTVKRFINPNTIMIVGSAPNFPDGIVDPIPELSVLAQQYNIGLHVDCCLGSFIISFAERAGVSDGIPVFDFRLPGVTAISCDTHKYGFCPKGSSIIMYRTAAFRRYQYFSMADWTGGVYASPSMAGSRPGSIIAGAWAVVNHIGIDGYTESCRTIVHAARRFAKEVHTRFAEDLFVLGDPKLSVVAFGSHTVNIYGVGDAMSKRGWHLNSISSPPALHMAFTRLSAQAVDQLLDDLEDVIALEKKEPTTGNQVALYGAGQTAVGPYVVEEVAKTFIDTLYA